MTSFAPPLPSPAHGLPEFNGSGYSTGRLLNLPSVPAATLAHSPRTLDATNASTPFAQQVGVCQHEAPSPLSLPSPPPLCEKIGGQ